MISEECFTQNNRPNKSEEKRFPLGANRVHEAVLFLGTAAFPSQLKNLYRFNLSPW